MRRRNKDANMVPMLTEKIKYFTPKEEMMTAIIHEAITDIGELEDVEVKSAFPKGSESILSDQERNAIDKLIKAVPDKNDTAAINYWVDIGDKIVYIEGWIDKCLAGTGFPDITEGGWSDKIDYIVELTNEILPRKARERSFSFLEGGFRQFEAGERAWLYGVTWGIYGKHLPKWVSRKGERT